jgi:hypothetical protein
MAHPKNVLTTGEMPKGTIVKDLSHEDPFALVELTEEEAGIARAKFRELQDYCSNSGDPGEACDCCPELDRDGNPVPQRD